MRQLRRASATAVGLPRSPVSPRPGFASRRDAATCRRRGAVLIIVLVVVAVLTLAAYAFNEVMLAENEVTQISGRQIQAYSLAASGVAHARAFLMQDAQTQADAGGAYDNPSRFQAVAVVQEEGDTEAGRFTVVAPALDTDGNASGIRYGLEDESARINLNALTTLEQAMKSLGGSETLQTTVGGSGTGQTAGGGSGTGQMTAKSGTTKTTPNGASNESSQVTSARNLLMNLPGMTEDVADAILDWLDEDSEPREYGAEAEYYNSLSPAYSPRNGQIETVEELLLVRGVTPQLLFGADVNRNGIIDAGEMNQSGATSSGDSQTLSTGWAGRLTLYSKENNLTAAGAERINLNEDDLQTLYDSLQAAGFPQDWTVFIVAYRQNGAYSGTGASQTYSSGELDLSQASKTKFTQVLDLVGKKVQVKFKNEQNQTVLQSPFAEDLVSMNSYMSTLMDQVTVVPAKVIPGRININQAPRDILLGIPGMTEDIVEQIISQRDPSGGAAGFEHETWLLTKGIVTLEEMRTLMPLVCARGAVHRAQVIGYYDDGRAASRLEVVLDATQQPARVLLWRDISHLGRGYALETLGASVSGETATR